MLCPVCLLICQHISCRALVCSLKQPAKLQYKQDQFDEDKEAATLWAVVPVVAVVVLERKLAINLVSLVESAKQTTRDCVPSQPDKRYD